MEANNDSQFSIKKYLSISIVISILSQISILVYYNQFGFYPIQYYEPTEIIISSAKDFIPITLLIFIYLQTIAAHKFIVVTDIIPNEGDAAVKKYFIRNTYTIINLFFLISISVGLYFFNKDFGAIATTAGMILFIELIKLNNRKFMAYQITDADYYERIKGIYPNLNLRILILGLLYIIMICSMAIGKAENVKKDNRYIGSEFTILDKEKIKITKKVLLIGKSKDYLFLYNKPDSSVRIIKRSDISKEVMRSKSRGIFQLLSLNF